MSTASLSISVTTLGYRSTIRLAGVLDYATAPSFTARATDILNYRTHVLTVDLAALTYCDTAGLDALVDLHTTGQGAGVRVNIANPSPSLRSSLGITQPDPPIDPNQPLPPIDPDHPLPPIDPHHPRPPIHPDQPHPPNSNPSTAAGQPPAQRAEVIWPITATHAQW